MEEFRDHIWCGTNPCNSMKCVNGGKKYSLAGSCTSAGRVGLQCFVKTETEHIFTNSLIYIYIYAADSCETLIHALASRKSNVSLATSISAAFSIQNTTRYIELSECGNKMLITKRWEGEHSTTGFLMLFSWPLPLSRMANIPQNQNRLVFTDGVIQADVHKLLLDGNQQTYSYVTILWN